MRIELDQRNRSVLFGHGAQDREADGMISSHTNAPHTGSEERINSLLDPAKGVLDGKRIYGKVSEVRDTVLGKGVHIQYGIPGPNNRRLNADVSWAEAWSRSVGGASVEGHAYQRDLQFLGLSDVGEAHERGYAREPGVLKRVNWLGMRQMILPAGLRHGRAS